MWGKLVLFVILTVFMALCVILINYQTHFMKSPQVATIESLSGEAQPQQKCTSLQASYLFWVKEVMFKGLPQS